MDNLSSPIDGVASEEIVLGIMQCRTQLKDRFMPILSDLKYNRNKDNHSVMISDLEDEVNLLADRLHLLAISSNRLHDFLAELAELADSESLGGLDSISNAINTAIQIINNNNERKTNA